MAVLTAPSPVWVCRSRAVNNVRGRRRLIPVISAAAAATITIKPKSIKTQTPTIGFVADRVLIKDRKVIGDEEVGIAMERLERVAEGVREMELEKLRSRLMREDMSVEERELVEIMSRDIVSSFFQKPIEYLIKSCDGRKMEEKLKDLNFLVGILEESYFAGGTTRGFS